MPLPALHFKSPYKKSLAISEASGFNVFLKFDNVQPTGSFKVRGIGNLCQKASEKQGMTKFVSSSGGNAGMAAAYCAKRLGKPIDIFTPESTPLFVVERLRKWGANVIVAGKEWDECNACAVEEASKPGAVYVPPFDHSDIWEGHASIIEELKSDVELNHGDIEKPDLIVCSVGGGGLLCGIVQGLKKVGWGEIPVLAVETEGASSLYQSVQAGRLVTLPAITSIAKTLGAKTVGAATLQCTKDHKVICGTVTDKEAVQAIVDFLNDERVLVEPACSASLAIVYSGKVRKLIENRELPESIRNVAVVVCGGSGMNLEMVEKWKKEFLD